MFFWHSSAEKGRCFYSWVGWFIDGWMDGWMMDGLINSLIH